MIFQQAIIIKIPLHSLALKITTSTTLILTIEQWIRNLIKEINTLINSSEFSEQIRINIFT